jgi:hypothetical protein
MQSLPTDPRRPVKQLNLLADLRRPVKQLNLLADLCRQGAVIQSVLGRRAAPAQQIIFGCVINGTHHD